jgi:hypothetical protein
MGSLVWNCLHGGIQGREATEKSGNVVVVLRDLCPSDASVRAVQTTYPKNKKARVFERHEPQNVR